jgi:hypothetical protein
MIAQVSAFQFAITVSRTPLASPAKVMRVMARANPSACLKVRASGQPDV